MFSATLVTNFSAPDSPLKTTSGLMHGSYEMQDYNGEKFEVKIPPFSLDIPDQKRSLN